nr:unnamed protein product [Digitaria exilis]
MRRHFFSDEPVPPSPSPPVSPLLSFLPRVSLRRRRLLHFALSPSTFIRWRLVTDPKPTGAVMTGTTQLMALPAAQPNTELIDASPPLILRLNEDLLAAIFLLLPVLADVGRTAVTCPAFHRVITDGSFLRRLRRTHPTPFLGLLFCRFHPAEVPHPSAPFARALERGADMSFSFLHSPLAFTRWFPMDARDGRVLLRHQSSRHFVVSDPISRRCLLLPQLMVVGSQHPFLFPSAAGDDKAAEMSFKVGCMVGMEGDEHEPDVKMLFVFSSETGQWRGLGRGAMVPDPKPFYACGRFYWKMADDTLFVYNPRAMPMPMELDCYLVKMPWRYGERDFVIAEVGEGRIGIFCLRHNDARAASSLICAIQRGHGEEEMNQWQFKRRIALPPQCRYSFAGATERYLLMHGAPTPWNRREGPPPDENSGVGIGYFTVETASMKIEKLMLPSTRLHPTLEMKEAAFLDLVILTLLHPGRLDPIWPFPSQAPTGHPYPPFHHHRKAEQAAGVAMASPEHHGAKRIEAPVATPPLLLLSDDLLAEIFLRLPALADVGRAATACSAFRRVVADRSFLRRLRSVHPLSLLGLLLFSSIHPTEPPHSNAPFARALERAADLSFSFFPSGGRWIPVDARGGRILLEIYAMSCDFAVCDPLSRRYLFLPKIPRRPAAQRRGRLEPFLLPANEEEADTSFRVVCVVECKPGQLVAFVFSSATGQWGSLTVDAILLHLYSVWSWPAGFCHCGGRGR